jgi:hypothetical protein
MPLVGSKSLSPYYDTVRDGSAWNNYPHSQYNYGGYFDVHTDNIANTNADDYFFPIAFEVGDQQPSYRVWIGRYYSLTPAPPQRNVSSQHYGGCAVDLCLTNGGWDAGSQLTRVRQVFNVYHTLIGSIHLPGNACNAHILYLRGGYRYYWYATTDIANSYWANNATAGTNGERHTSMVYGLMNGTEGDTSTGFRTLYNGNVQNTYLVQHESSYTPLTSGTTYSGNW